MLRRLLQLPPKTFADAALPLLSSKKIVNSAIVGVDSWHPKCSHLIHFRQHFINLHKMVDKEAVEKEKARLKDELSRGYFADISEFQKHRGKIAPASKTLIPSAEAIKFPDLEVNFSDGSSLRLPISDQDVRSSSPEIISSATLICLSFRASSQRMAESWSIPFLNAFSTSPEIRLYEVSFVESWILSSNLFKRLFLKVAKRSDNPQRRIVYSFGDHYDIRKKLQIVNLLTGYIFLNDKHGRIRWQGFGSATEVELSSLISCMSLLLKE
ncbi:hypothetical protein AXF42_Ash015668 [Apostasia shenzhenica]|uniref:Mitochondrial ATPase complex subunit ATP10 n=1 Tax=Apostasia shenzhenica TaxID=1088818 RepID=A0A2H9ZU09_9ASPA|nr:hypothetical protein AXF42_Ash015668 [Apostasia shenzhenica]